MSAQTSTDPDQAPTVTGTDLDNVALAEQMRAEQERAFIIANSEYAETLEGRLVAFQAAIDEMKAAISAALFGPMEEMVQALAELARDMKRQDDLDAHSISARLREREERKRRMR